MSKPFDVDAWYRERAEAGGMVPSPEALQAQRAECNRLHANHSGGKQKKHRPATYRAMVAEQLTAELG